MDNKITIIEGPTPDFDLIEDAQEEGSASAWTAGVLEGPLLYRVATTSVRAFNSQALLERCTRAWKQNQTMFLEYRDEIGLRKEALIIAAQALTVEEGDILQLWVRRDLEESEHSGQDLNADDEDGEDDDFTDDPPF
ncbi:MAG: hypothetical protein GX415_04450 [Chloroflexi bacterium]|jgi:hypothetical protein|nr:hypothetical protein [Anaerolineaceae bacterium]NLI44647.1 hypothetical protein [Chloroflexota bacterium]HOE35289.1 hypothetical protein [Anaerolineaceae bacterium]HOT25687.1 hypothetical protein [Anaerolineaceae bacterium]HQH57867.1 hypothetical protein [Anaerolineaceae bacterium]